MEKYVCVVCGWVYDEAVEGVKFEDQPADYVCPICGVGKDQFEKMQLTCQKAILSPLEIVFFI